MIKIVAKMLVRPDKVDEFKTIAAELVRKSRAEAGNIYYTLNESTSDPRCLAFIECWEDQDAIAAHNATEHFQTILPRLSALCEKGQPADLFTEIEY